MKRIALWMTILGLLPLAACARVKGESPADLRAALQPPLSAETSSTLAQAPTLHAAVVLTAHRNPSAAARRLEWLAAIHQRPQAYAPENLAIRDLSYDFEMQEWASVIIEQELPWPQRLWGRGRVAQTDAEIARLRYEIALRDAVIETKDLCYELYYLDHARDVTSEVQSLFNRYAGLAYGEAGNGRTQLNEAFRAESQAAQLAYDVQLLTEQREALAERLRASLNLPPGTAIGAMADAPSYPVDPDRESLFARAEQFAEALKIRGLESERAGYETYLARLERLPDLMPGALINGFASGNPTYMGMLSLRLPIWEWRNRAMIREREAMREAARQMQLDTLNTQRAAVASAWYAVRVNERLVTLYDATLLPQAESVMQQAELLFRTDQASYSNLLESTLAWHNFRLASVRARADLGIALGQLERAIGTTAEARP